MSIKAKKFYAFCLIAALIAGLSLFLCFSPIKPYTADSANIAVAADSTENMIYWGIDGNGTLYLDSNESSVTGYNPHGELDASINNNASPWATYRLDVKKVIVNSKIKPTSTAYWFQNFSDLLSIERITNIDMSNVTDMSHMFEGCAVMNLNLSNFTLNSNTNVEGLLSGCSAGTITLPKWSADNTVTEIELPSKFWSSKHSEDITVATYKNSGETLSKHAVHIADQMKSKPNRIEANCTQDGHIAYWKCFTCGKYFSDEACTDANEITLSETVLPALGHKYTNGVCTVCSALDPDADFIYWCLHQIDGGYDLYLGNSDFSSDIKNTSYNGFFSTDENVVPWGGGATISMDKFRNVVIQSVIKPKFTDGWFLGFGLITEMNLSNLDTSEVTSMNEMFSGCISLQSIIGIEQWDTSKVTSMSCMFDHCEHLTSLDLSNFNTDNVNNLNEIFSGHSTLLELSLFDININASCDMMFSECTNLNKITFKNIDGDENKSIELPDSYFDGTEIVGSVNTTHSNKTLVRHSEHKIIHKEGKDATCTEDGNIEYWQCDICHKYFNNVACADENEIALSQTVISAFGHNFVNGVCTVCGAYQPIYWGIISQNQLIISSNKSDVSSALEGQSGSFAGDANFSPASNVPWNSYKSTVTYIEVKGNVCPKSTQNWFNLFALVTEIKLDGLNTSNVENMAYMFKGCRLLRSLDLTKFNTENVTNMDQMFYACNIDPLDLNSFTIGSGTSVRQMISTAAFQTIKLPKSIGTNIDLPGANFWDGSKLVTGMVSSENNGATLEKHYHYFVNGVCGTCGTAQPIYWAVTNEYELIFSNQLDYINNLQNKQMSGLIHSNRQFDAQTHDYVPWESFKARTDSSEGLKKVTVHGEIYPISCKDWFSNAVGITSMNLSELKTMRITDMSFMFSGCESLTSLDLSQFDTSNVTNMAEMFSDCANLSSLDVTGFNTEKVTDFTFMFNGCASLETLNLSSFSLVGSPTVLGVFGECDALDTIVLPKVISVPVDLPGTFWDIDGDKTFVNSTSAGHTVYRHDNHNVTHVAANAPTCTEDGNIEYWQCSVCKKYFNNATCADANEITLSQTVDPKLGHDYGEWTITKAATCEEKGSRYRVCKHDSNHVETEVIAALGHDYGEWTVIKAATCEEKGSRTRVCKHDINHIETEDIAALGHDYGEWTVTKQATIDEEGKEQRVCAHDPSHVEVRSIPKLPPAPETKSEPVDIAPLVAVIVVLSVIILTEVGYLIYRKMSGDKHKKEDEQ